MFFEFGGKKLPIISIGTSPFIGATQFGFKGKLWKMKFLNDVDNILNILREGYKCGARGVHVIPQGKILDAALIMKECYNNFTIMCTANAGILGLEKPINYQADIIFVRSTDNILFEHISSRGVIPGIATHDPSRDINYVIRNGLSVKCFLTPFNKNGFMMKDKERLENIVNKRKDYLFIGMKTLSAGNLKPNEAFEYISKHNIRGICVGAVNKKQVRETTNSARRFLC